MKVLQVINNLGSGGAEKLIEQLAPIMNKKDDIQVDVLLLTNKGNIYQESLENQGINVEIVKFNNMYDPRNIFQIVKYINEQKYDVVHSHVFPTQYWVALASLFLNRKETKFITTEHSTTNRRREKFFFRPLEKFVYSRYKQVISISKIAKDNLIEWINPSENKLKNYILVENGIDLQLIENAQPYEKKEMKEIFDCSISNESIFISMVARFTEQKDQATLIKAIKKLPDNYQLLLLGEGPLMQDCIELAKKKGVYERVHFLGFRSDVERILKTSDIIVLSTHLEGLSLSSIEALASGRPFIASDVPGVRGVVRNRGLLFEDGNVDELVSHILSLTNNQELYDKVVQRSVKASKNYDINYMVDHLISLYQE